MRWWRRAAVCVNLIPPAKSMIPRSDSSYGCQWVSTVLRPPLLHLVLHPAVAIPRLGTGRKSGRLCSAKTVCGNIDFVMDAPCSIVFVADMTRLPEGGHVRSMALVDAGIACENLNLACVSEGVATVPRATMDVAGLSELLGLTELQIPVMNNPVGYARQR